MSLLKRLGGSEEFQVKSIPVTKSPAVYSKKNFSGSEIETRLHNFLVDELKKPEHTGKNIETLINRLADQFFERDGDLLTYEEKRDVLENVTNELTAYGPITPIINDPDVTEVMVNGPSDVYIEKNGRIYKTDTVFKDENHVLRVIEKIVSPLGRRIDESSPMVDARLPDGSRVNAIIPPLSLIGPVLTIRKFSKDPYKIEDLIRFGTISEDIAEFLEGCVKSKLNIFVSGGTGSGKTTTLNVLSSFIPPDERIVTIEDAAELRLSQEHIVSLESRPPNIEGKGAITIRDLVRNSLRMRPDRIIVGEVRSAEALDMLQAMNTGHDGSLGTGHANSPRDLLSRLETMVLMAGFDLPVRAIREQIAGALDLIIQQERMRDGSRKITSVTEVLGLEGDTIVLQDLFTYKESGLNFEGKVEGQFSPTGIRPHFADLLELHGVKLKSSWFSEEWRT